MNRKSQIAPIVLVLAIAGGFVAGGVLPIHRRLASARAEMHQVQQSIDDETAKLVTLSSLHTEVTRLREHAVTFERAIPRQHELGEFLAALADIVERHGLANHIFQPRPARPIEAERLPASLAAAVGGIHVQPVLIQCEGTFEALFKTVRDIEKLPRLSQIDTLKVSGDPKRNGYIKVEFLLNIFFRSPVELPAAAPGGR